MEITGKVQTTASVGGCWYLFEGDMDFAIRRALCEHAGKTVRLTVDEVTEFTIQRGDVSYQVLIYPEKFDVIRTEGELATIHSFNTYDIGPEHVKARQDRAALKAVLAMLDEIDSSLFLRKTHESDHC
jgi:hypothetical protein